jgi:fluoride exporter
MPPLSELLLVAAGGAVGSVVRYALAIASLRFPGGTTLAGTFTANLIGCFAIGLLTAIVTNHPDWLSPRTVIGIRVGMLGGLTTFSTFAAESVLLADQARYGWMMLYVVATVLLGLIAVYAGAWTVTWQVASPQDSRL